MQYLQNEVPLADLAAEHVYLRSTAGAFTAWWPVKDGRCC